LNTGKKKLTLSTQNQSVVLTGGKPMTKEEFAKMRETNRRRQLLIKTLFEDCLDELHEAENSLEKAEVMVNYNNKVKECYEAELAVKGSLGNEHCECE
tara:strand:- start:676 stop:969 length:294 start_codon:yes stop_codon:yes gene_type:complete